MNFCLPSHTQGTYRMEMNNSNEYNKFYNNNLVQLIKRMYSDDPGKRPSAEDALKELEEIIQIINYNNFLI